MSSGTADTLHLPWTGPPADPAERLRAQVVQARLRPSAPGRRSTLDLAGHCLPGRAVGGDFYDFLQPAADRWVVLLGDISGHGLPAAMMMAALQASLRAHYAACPAELDRRIESVNRLFFDCTADAHYAGLVAAELDAVSGELRFANCGHLAPWLVRADGSVERLAATGRPLGLFARWGGAVATVTLAAGDTLVAVTDGIVEATDPCDGEFGELRLLSSILRQRHLPSLALTHAIARDVQLSCRQRPFDDATIVVVRRLDRARPTTGDE